MTGTFVTEFAFKRSNQAETLATRSSVKFDREKIQVDPQLLFQRLIVAFSSLSCAAIHLLSLILRLCCSNHTSQPLLMLFGIWLWNAKMSQLLKESSNLFWMTLHSFTESLGREGVLEMYVRCLQLCGPEVWKSNHCLWWTHKHTHKDMTEERRTGEKGGATVTFTDDMKLTVKKNHFQANKTINSPSLICLVVIFSRPIAKSTTRQLMLICS